MGSRATRSLLIAMGVGLAARLATGSFAVAHSLTWAPFPPCTEFSVTVDESFEDPRYALLFNRAPEHSVARLKIDLPADGRRPTPRVILDSEDAGVRTRTPRSPQPMRILRDLRAGRVELGPAAPDLACRDRSWNPAEDALALGWPRLPSNPVPRGARWRGAPVHGDGSTCSARASCCALAECRDGACSSRSWAETLVRVEGESAVVRSQWSASGVDGARAERSVRVDLGPEGASLRSAEMVVRHPSLGVVRTLRMERTSTRCAPTPGTPEPPPA